VVKMNKIQQYKEILEQAPEGATHWSEFENVYYKRECEEWMYATNGNQCFAFVLQSEGDYVEDDAQLLSDLQTIVEQAETIERLKSALEQVVQTENMNTGHEPSLSCFHRAIDEAGQLLKELNND